MAPSCSLGVDSFAQAHDVQRKIDIAVKTLNASASAKEQKQREIDEAKLRTRHRKQEIDELKQAVKDVASEAREVAKQAQHVKKLAAKAEAKTADAEAARAAAEGENSELKTAAGAVDAEVAAAKRASLQSARERDALAAQHALLSAQEKDKADAVAAAKKLLDILHVQQRALALETSALARSVNGQREEVAALEVYTQRKRKKRWERGKRGLESPSWGKESKEYKSVGLGLKPIERTEAEKTERGATLVN
jgi:chromosome segregation ATPase